MHTLIRPVTYFSELYDYNIINTTSLAMVGVMPASFLLPQLLIICLWYTVGWDGSNFPEEHPTFAFEDISELLHMWAVRVMHLVVIPY